MTWYLLVHLFFSPAVYADLISQPSTTISSYTSTSQLSGYQETLRLLEGGQQALQTAGNLYYVSLTGSNTNNGSQNQAWKSIDYAVSRLKAGDTLYIQEGVYKETVDLKSSGTESAYISIVGLGNVVIDGATLGYYEPVFDTKGYSYIQFFNLEVNNARSGVEISPGSTHILINGLTTHNSQFAVKMKDASYITVLNCYATGSRNGFRGEGVVHDVLFENIETYFSKDVYPGYDPNAYINGDGFIFENQTYNLTFRNIITGNHSDAGIDIKGANVLIENITTFNNTNGMKLWGNNITVINALSYGNKTQRTVSAGNVDGMGVNVRSGSTTIINSTFVDNEQEDMKVGPLGTLRLENSIVARQSSTGKLLGKYGIYTEKNVLWYRVGRSTPEFTLLSGSLWANPDFVDWANKDFRIKSTSKAIDRGLANSLLPTYDLDYNDRIYNSVVDLGAFEYQPTVPPVINQAPVFGIPDSQTTSENQLISFIVTATDSNNDALTYSASGLPQGATFDAQTRLFSWTPNYNQAGSYSVVFSVFDGILRTDKLVTILVSNVNRAPSFQSVGDRSVAEGELLIFSVQANDPDGDALIFSAVNLPPGSVFDVNTRIFSWTPTMNQAGNYSVTFRVSDGTVTTDKILAITVSDSVLPPSTDGVIIDQTLNTQNYAWASGTVYKYSSDILAMYGNRTVAYDLLMDASAPYFLTVDTAQVTSKNAPPDYQFNFNVYIDDVLVGNYNFSAAREFKTSEVISLGALSQGTHRVKLQWKNDTNGAGYDANVGLKNLTLYQGTTGVPAPTPIPTPIPTPTLTPSFSQAARLDSSEDYLTAADSADWSFGTGDFTVDFWTSIGSANNSCLVSQYLDENNFWRIKTDSSRNLEMVFRIGGVTKATYVSTGHSWNWDGTWKHIAFVRKGGNVHLFVNGVSYALTTTTESGFPATSIGANDVGNISAPLYVGAYSGGFSNANVSIGEVRISKGLARWTSNFTPSAQPYQTDSYTKLLLHMDGDAIDSSLAGHQVRLLGNTFFGTL